MVRPAYEIRMVKENLDLSLALLQAAQEEKVTAKQLFRDGPEEMFTALAVDTGPNQAELTRRVANQVRAAFVLSVIQTQRSLDRVFTNAPIDEENPDLQAARCVLYLLNCTVYPNLFAPVWDCPREYRRKFEVRPINLLMDADALHGRGLKWDHLGGLPQYLDLLEYFAHWIEDLPEINVSTLEVPAALSPPPVKPENHPATEPEAVPANPAPAEKIDWAVARFVAERCDLGGQNRTLAKDLYAGFQHWRREAGQEDVSQRSFGMQLTAMGLQRRRRGRGKHWWEGIRLSGRPETAANGAVKPRNGHYQECQPEPAS